MAPRAAPILFLAVLLLFPTPCNSFTMPPPWVILWGGVAFAKTFATVKDLVFLFVDVLFGGEGAACTLCDKIVTVLLAGDAEGGMEDLDCTGMCFRLDKCVKICNNLKKALASTAGFPCVAAGYCPAVDEFGPMPKCKYKFPASCSPSNMCAFKFPKCELSEGDAFSVSRTAMRRARACRPLLRHARTRAPALLPSNLSLAPAARGVCTGGLRARARHQTSLARTHVLTANTRARTPAPRALSRTQATKSGAK